MAERNMEILFKDEDGKKFWDNSLNDAKEDYGCMCVVNFAKRWALAMQKLIAEEKLTVSEAAEATCCDSEICGDISGLTYSTAAFLLSRSWKYGNEFLKWHNGKYGYSGNGIVNPAGFTLSR